MKNPEMSVAVKDIKISPVCKHCGRRSSQPIEWGGNSFCCHGCVQVYQVLEAQGLKDYYSIRDQISGSTVSPAESDEERFEFADRQDFLEKYAYGPDHNVLDIYVEGVNCAACLWLLEKLPRYQDNVASARLNMADGVLTVMVQKPGFAKVLQQIQDWGYRPRPLKNNSEQRFWLRRDQHRDLSRIGVAAFCAGNIMLLSICLYAGLGGDLKDFFVMFSFVMSLPVLLFSATPLYMTSWNALKRGRVSIDLPIVIAMMTAFTMSFYGWKTGGDTYFDSMTALVFLILSSRFFLKRIQQKHLQTSRLQMYVELKSVRKWDGKHYVSDPAEGVRAGDRLLVKKGEMVPADGVIESGQGELNVSLLTGESAPVEIKAHQPVYMGTRLTSGRLEMTVDTDFHDSRIQKLLREIELEAPQARSLKIAEQVGQAFLALVLVAALGVVLFWWPTDPRTGFYRALSFIIVACPCTFASVLPLVFGLALKKSAAQQIFIKDTSIFERIGRVNKIFFDKTGVLTEGVFDVLSFQWISQPDPETLDHVFSAAAASDHPVSRALARYLSQVHPHLISLQKVHCESLPGRGVLVKFFDGTQVSIQKAETEESKSPNFIPNSVEIRVNGTLEALVTLGDRVRGNSMDVVEFFHQRGMECWILSGDQTSAVLRVAHETGIPKERALSNLTFEDKKRIVTENPTALMLGDGNNDALALKNATVSVAMQGGVESALQSSQVYLSSGDLSSFLQFYLISKSTHKMIYASLIISVIYNITAGSLAVLGWIHPLLAAFIMPVNAMTVFAVCLWVYRDRSSQWK